MTNEFMEKYDIAEDFDYDDPEEYDEDGNLIPVTYQDEEVN